MGAGKLLWGYHKATDTWIPLQVDINGKVVVDMSAIKLGDLADVSVAAPADDDLFYYDQATGLWKSRKLVDADIPAAIARDAEVASAVADEATARVADVDAEEAARITADTDHAALTTGVHGVGPGTIASVSTGNKTIYVDKAATGAADGTSWADAFTTIQAAVDSLEDIILHAYTIKVRKGATPYRETVYLNSNPAVNPGHSILGSLTIEAEYYWYGDCEANVGGAGEITDTGAFADVAIGDHVFLLDCSGANDRAQDYELCTVDDISNAPNRIGTDGTKTPTTNWKYVIVRTEISGSDDGTDGGTARDFCFYLIGINNVNIYGFYLTFADTDAVWYTNCRNVKLYYFIAKNTDGGVVATDNSTLIVYYAYIDSDSWEACFNIRSRSHGQLVYAALNATILAIRTYNMSSIAVTRAYMFGTATHYAVLARGNSFITVYYSTITNGYPTGLFSLFNSIITDYALTNNAPTPRNPAASTEGAYIVTTPY